MIARIAVMALILWLSTAAQGQPAPRPNVILVIADDLRNDLGCYSHPIVKSPNIDRLAARGVRFDRAYCQYPVCNPSRTSFLAGLRPDATRVLDNGTQFRKNLPDVVTLPQLFRQNGYFTASLGKIFHRGLNMEEIRPEMDDAKSWDKAMYFQATEVGHKGEGRNMTDGKLAWCRWLAAEGEDEDQPDGQIAREAIKLLEEHKDRPFFLAVGFHKPHDPFIAPKKYFDLYPPDSLKLPDDQAAREGDPEPAIGRAARRNMFGEFTDREKREFTRAYYAGVSFMDAQLGKVLDALERLKLADKTIVIFMGDHGYHLGERGWWNKGTVFELSARAPLIIAAPGQPAAKACPRVVEFLDLYPTLVDLAGLKPPSHLQGKSLRPLLEDAGSSWDRPAFTQVQRGRIAGRSVRTARWRYTEWDGGKAGVELYDHDADPREHHNLAAEERHRAVAQELSRLLDGTGKPE